MFSDSYIALLSGVATPGSTRVQAQAKLACALVKFKDQVPQSKHKCIGVGTGGAEGAVAPPIF